MVGTLISHLYSRLFCQSTSIEELLLCVGNSDGKVIVFDICGLLSQNSNVGREKLHNPLHSIQAHNDSVYSMTSTEDYCVTGATGAVSGWKWKDLRHCDAKPSWTISLECDQSNFGTPEVNSLAYDSERNVVYAACGDWRTRAYDLETGKETFSLEGHENYVHDVVISGNQVVSAGEDGQVLIWDLRVGKEPKVKLQPYTNKDIQRPHLGKFITSVDIENDWLICGGGPQAGIFHLRSLAFTTALEPTDTAVNVTKFTRQGLDRGGIVVAGAVPTVYVCNISGDVTAEIPTASSCIYTVHIMDKPHLLATMGGAGATLDVCLNLNYRDHSVSTVLT